jgi:uncharacterized protein
MYRIQNLLLLVFFIPVVINAQPFDRLAKAVMNKDTTTVNQLLASGIDVNVRDEQTNTTVLMVASSYSGYASMIELMIQRGADVNAQSNDGKTALMWAAGNSPDAVEMLLNHRADVKLKMSDGMTAFLQSIFGILSGKVSTSVCDLLLKKGANVNAELTSTAAMGWTALHYAAVNGDVELVKYLIRKGANVNHKSAEGSSALYLAKQNGYKDVVNILEKAGALE